MSMATRNKLTRSIIMIAVIILVAFLANKFIARQVVIREANDPADDVLMTITARGGECENESCHYPVREIRGDGSYTHHDALSEEEVASLQSLILETDFTKSLPESSRTCGSSQDKTDTIWTFPEKYGKDRWFAACEIDIDDQARQKINSLTR